MLFSIIQKNNTQKSLTEVLFNLQTKQSFLIKNDLKQQKHKYELKNSETNSSR